MLRFGMRRFALALIITLAQASLACAETWIREKRFIGHFDQVFSMTLDLKRQQVITGGRDGTIRFWGMDGSALGIVTGHLGGIKGIGLSPDGNRLVSASWDGTVRLWDLASESPRARPFKVLRGHIGHARFAQFSPDGKWLVSSGASSTLRVWDAAAGTQTTKWDIREEENGTRAMAVSPNRGLVAVGSSNKFLQLWNIPEATLFADLKGQENWVWALAFNADGSLLASGSSNDRSIRLWSIPEGKLLRTLRGHTDSVYTLAFSADGKTLLSSGIDETFRVWNVADGALLHTEKVGDIVNSMALTPDGNRLFLGEIDGTIEIWRRDAAPKTNP